MIKKIQFDGFDALEISTSALKAILVYEVGPRIAFFGKADGPNLLYWDKDGPSRNGWKLFGGHRVWLTRPMADESEDTYLPDNSCCSIELTETKAIAIAKPDSYTHLERGMEVEIISENQIRVRNFVKNSGDLIYSGGVWSPTCVDPDGKQIVIPLGVDDTSWDIVRIVIPRVFAGNHTVLEDDQAAFEGNDLVITPKGRTLKRCCCAPKGKVLLKCDGYTFEKYTPYNKLFQYPFEGCNVACFVGMNNFMAEMESFGGESEVIPGEVIENIEYWSII
ncbi:MAG: hypothetical protein Q8S22_04680 [Eubacteriales bacterium]|nr:hypothetical protein [Eubacteriales bacterium]